MHIGGDPAAVGGIDHILRNPGQGAACFHLLDQAQMAPFRLRPVGRFGAANRPFRPHRVGGVGQVHFQPSEKTLSAAIFFTFYL